MNPSAIVLPPAPVARRATSRPRQPIAFEDLRQLRQELPSAGSFQQLVESMEDRFVGLPGFHRSVDLHLYEHRRLITGQETPLEAPRELLDLTRGHLARDLEELLAFVNRAPGRRSLGFLELGIRLNPDHLAEHLEHLERAAPGAPVRSLLRAAGSRIEVPIRLALASRQDGEQYESLAVGIRGLSRYTSSIFLSRARARGRFLVEGGLAARVDLEHIDHPISRLLRLVPVLPASFFDDYVRTYMLPERPAIARRLCEHVFDGARLGLAG